MIQTVIKNSNDEKYQSTFIKKTWVMIYTTE